MTEYIIIMLLIVMILQNWLLQKKIMSLENKSDTNQTPTVKSIPKQQKKPKITAHSRKLRRWRNMGGDS